VSFPAFKPLYVSYVFLCLLLQIIFLLNSVLAWIMKTDMAIKLIQKWSFDYIKMDCAGEKCYGVLAVRLLTVLSFCYFLTSY
jgi:hypothetical protein